MAFCVSVRNCYGLSYDGRRKFIKRSGFVNIMVAVRGVYTNVSDWYNIRYFCQEWSWTSLLEIVIISNISSPLLNAYISTQFAVMICKDKSNRNLSNGHRTA